VESLPTHTHSNQCDWKELLRRAYHIYLSGGYGVYYYNNTAWDVVKPDPEPPGMQRFQLLKEVLSSLPYWRMMPADHLALGGRALALPGEAYVFYAESAQLTVNLRELEDSGEVSAQWVNTWDGSREVVSIRPGIHRVKKPESFGKAPGVLIVKQRGASW